jgi:vancomycin permeability regulator SanA
MKRRSKPKRSNWAGAALLLLLALAVGVFGWCRWVYCRLRATPAKTRLPRLQAAPFRLLDAIGVFGAAEYDGRPSPVYRARLDHALALYHHGIAPLIITLGGNGGDQYNEGAVGREYLMAMGVPEQRHHRRDREPQYRGIGPPHRRHRPRQRPAAAGDRQRRHAPLQNPRDLRRRRGSTC